MRGRGREEVSTARTTAKANPLVGMDSNAGGNTAANKRIPSGGSVKEGLGSLTTKARSLSGWENYRPLGREPERGGASAARADQRLKPR